MKIVFFSNSITMGGMESHLLNLACEFTRQDDCQVMQVILPTAAALNPLEEALTANGIQTVRLTLNGYQSLAERLHSFFRLVRLLKDSRADIFHQQRTGPFHGKWAALAARAAGVPVVIATEHNAPLTPLSHGSGWSGSAKQWINRAADGLLDRLIVVSQENFQRQVALGHRKAHFMKLVYNGIDLARFTHRASPEKTAALRQSLGIPAATRLVGFTGRLHPDKGVGDFLDMLAMLDSSVCGLVVGDGPLADALHQQADDLGLSRRIIFTGYRTDVDAMLSLRDVVVLPSRVEPFGLVVVEALASGHPVVATRVGGVPEIITDGQSGLLVTPGDTAGLAAGVQRILDDPALAAHLCTAGQTAAAKFSLKAMAVHTLQVYAEAAGRRSFRGDKTPLALRTERHKEQ